MIIHKFGPILSLFIQGHISIVPLAPPTISGVTHAKEHISIQTDWLQIGKNVLQSQEIVQPDGVLIEFKFDY